MDMRDMTEELGDTFAELHLQAIQEREEQNGAWNDDSAPLETEEPEYFRDIDSPELEAESEELELISESSAERFAESVESARVLVQRAAELIGCSPIPAHVSSIDEACDYVNEHYAERGGPFGSKRCAELDGIVAELQGLFFKTNRKAWSEPFHPASVSAG